MIDELDSLLVLQERDQRVHTLQRELEALPKERTALEEKLKRQAALLEQEKGRVKQLEADRRKRELEGQSKKDQIARYKTQQMETRKNEEYQALAHEINHAQEDIQKLDDEQMTFMEQIEAGQQVVAKAQSVYAEAEAHSKQAFVTLDQKKAGMEKALAEAKALQAEAAGKISEVVLRRYQRIMAAKKENAVVALYNGSCGGCHMKVTSQTMVSVKARSDLVSCDNCGRLLYLSA